MNKVNMNKNRVINCPPLFNLNLTISKNNRYFTNKYHHAILTKTKTIITIK